MAAEVVEANGGWAVAEPGFDGKVLFVGRDGYWTKLIQAVAPWRSQQAARDYADDLNKLVHPHVFR